MGSAMIWAAFIRDMHGLPATFHAFFSVRKEGIQSYDLVYSRHDLWVLHSGLLSIISAVLFVFVIIRWIRFYRNSIHSGQQESEMTKSELDGAGQPPTRREFE